MRTAGWLMAAAIMAAIRLMDMDMDIRLMDMDTDIRITGWESASVTAVGGAADTVIVPSFTGITTTGITGITAANGAGESLRLSRGARKSAQNRGDELSPRFWHFNAAWFK